MKKLPGKNNIILSPVVSSGHYHSDRWKREVPEPSSLKV